MSAPQNDDFHPNTSIRNNILINKRISFSQSEKVLSEVINNCGSSFNLINVSTLLKKAI
jgi:hypothetical protein